MTTGSLSRVVWKISFPIILAQANETILHLIDTAFLARVGVTELGAIAVADSVLLLFLVLPIGLADGIQILAARRAGQRRPEAIGVLFIQGLVLVVVVCIASTAARKLVWPTVGSWFVESDAVNAAVNGFLQIASYGITFTSMNFAYSALFVSPSNAIGNRSPAATPAGPSSRRKSWHTAVRRIVEHVLAQQLIQLPIKRMACGRRQVGLHDPHVRYRSRLRSA